MDKYQESLIKSMELLAGSMDKKSQGTGTYEGTIVDIIDDESYYVNFRGNTIRCYTSNISLKYSIGERVIFIVPQNDFTEHKTIVGSSTPGSTTYDQEQDLTGWVNVSGNLLKGKNKDDIYKLCTLRESENYYLNGVEYTKPIPLDEIDIKILNEYIVNGYTNFKFGFKLFTMIQGYNQAYGNYGMRFTLHYRMRTQKQNGNYDEGYKVIVIDNDNILGNPYKQEDPNYTEQSTMFRLDSNIKILEGELQFFTEGFPVVNKDNNGNPTGIATEDQCDIYIKNIQINALDTIANMNGIHLNIVSDNGYYLTSEYGIPEEKEIDKDILFTELQPYLLVNGEIVDLDNDAVEDISWYEEDDRIDSHSPYYREEGGVQWKCINRVSTAEDKDGNITTDDTNTDHNTGEPIFNFLTKQMTAIAAMYNVKFDFVPDALVWYSKNIKCVVKYKGAYINAIVNIINLDAINDLEINLYPTNGQSEYSPTFGNVNMTCELKGEFAEENIPLTQIYYHWSLYNRNMQLESSNGFYTLVSLNKYDQILNSIFTEIAFPTHLINEYCFIKVSAYYKLGDKDNANSDLLIGSKTVALSTNDNLTYILGVENSEPLYKYDKDGDSPLTGDMYDGPASSKIKDTKPMKVKIYNKDGSEIDDDNYAYATYEWLIPKNSLIEQINADTWSDYNESYYRYTGRELEYTIAKKYKRDKNDNTIILKVTYDGVILNQLITIQFIKDYFDGIEGSKYSLFLTLDETGTGAGDDDHCFAYEQKDDNGIHKLRLYENGLNSNSWFYAYDNYSNKQLQAFTKAYFKVKIYRDGELLDIDNSKIEWKMFGEGKKSTEAGLKITKGAAGTGELSYDKHPVVNQTNIIQVSYTVSDEGKDNKKSYKLYAYYPIECIVIQTGVSGVIKAAPTIDYGFNTVIYTSEGVNPQYDYAYDYELNYGDIVDSYFSTNATKFLRDNFKNKNGKTWEGNSDNFDSKQSVIKPAQKYNRNQLDNRLQLTGYETPKADDIQSTIEGLEIDLGRKQPKYNWNSAKDTWEKIQDYINSHIFDYFRSCLEKREESSVLKSITTNFYNGLISANTIPFNDIPIEDFKNSIYEIYNNIEDIENLKYYDLVVNFINPLKDIINVHFTLNNNQYEISDILQNKYKLEKDVFSKDRERITAEIEAYTNLKVLGSNILNFYQPVAFLYDVEMLAEIENYDGTQKIGTGSQELNIINQGAGVIDGDGFSGIALGSQKEQGKLIGYCHNQQTFTLDRHGNLTLLGQTGSNCGYCLGNDQSGGNLEVAGKTTIHGDETIDGRFALFSAGFAACNLEGYDYDYSDEEEDEEEDENNTQLPHQYGNGGALFAIANKRAPDYGFEDALSGISSASEDSWGLWCGYSNANSPLGFRATNNPQSIGTFKEGESTPHPRGNGANGAYAYNLLIGGDTPAQSKIGFSEDGSAAFANGTTYIDAAGNFVSPNLICGVANGSGSTPGLGLGYIGSNQGQLAVAGGSITACGNIPITITGEGGVWGGIKINSQNSLANPRLKVVKGEAANKPVLYNGWIKINNQEIYINGPITLPPTQSDTIIKEGDFDGECGGNATDASIYYTYTISKGEGTASASIAITCHRTQGTGSEPHCSCDCDETKSDYAEWYTWTGNEKVYWNYSNGVFSWNLDELKNPEKQGRFTDHCQGDPCEEEE